ncbi:MAG: hypothetical protein BWY94_01628 [Actinobacteria bacterium ADurb.BinA094]|nr:MAG: hypothetical protein BWY94_01628 [Actinobacteria bacterium ADurb.BinA094]
MAAVGAHLVAPQITGQPAAQLRLQTGAVETAGVVLEHPGHATFQRQEADGVAVAHVDEHGVASVGRQGAEQGGRPGVADQGGPVCGEPARHVGRGAETCEHGWDGVRLVEEPVDRLSGGDRLLPEGEAQHAVGAVRGVAVVLHRDGHRREARLHAEQAQGLRERLRVQVAGADLDRGSVPAAQQLVGVVVVHEADAEGAHLVRIVGEARRGRGRGHEGMTCGQMRPHRPRHRAAAHDRPTEDDRLAARRGRPDAGPRHLGRRRHHELDGVLERLTGPRQEDVGGAGADVHGEHAGLVCGGHGREGLAVGARIRRDGSWARRAGGASTR